MDVANKTISMFGREYMFGMSCCDCPPLIGGWRKNSSTAWVRFNDGAWLQLKQPDILWGFRRLRNAESHEDFIKVAITSHSRKSMTTEKTILDITNGLVEGDITDDFYSLCLREGYAGVDCETGRIDFKQKHYWESVPLHITTVSSGNHYQVVRHDPENYAAANKLRRLLKDRNVVKYFHHAMFDMRFLMHHLGANIDEVECTKLLAKTLGVPCKASLRNLLEFFGVGEKLDVGDDIHDGWGGELTPMHISYCEADAKHLRNLAKAIAMWWSGADIKEKKLGMERGGMEAYAALSRALPHVARMELTHEPPFGY